jgi:hypothetical protein
MKRHDLPDNSAAKRAMFLLRDTNLTHAEALLGKPLRIEDGKAYIGNKELTGPMLAAALPALEAIQDKVAPLPHDQKVKRAKYYIQHQANLIDLESALRAHFSVPYAHATPAGILVQNRTGHQRRLSDTEIVEFYDAR